MAETVVLRNFQHEKRSTHQSTFDSFDMQVEDESIGSFHHSQYHGDLTIN